MAKRTLREKFEIALKDMGEMWLGETSCYVKYSRKEGGYYYLGRAGALRYGPTIAASVPCSTRFREALLRFIGD
jgi:hypothetical protein